MYHQMPTFTDTPVSLHTRAKRRSQNNEDKENTQSATLAPNDCIRRRSGSSRRDTSEYNATPVRTMHYMSPEILGKSVTASPSNVVGSPLTPVQNLVNRMRHRVDVQLSGKAITPMCTPQIGDQVSPGLARLRNTPVGAPNSLRVKQEILKKKHRETRQNIDTLNVGGGVCIWPEMERMRLTMAEGVHLVLISVSLLVFTTVGFHFMHGDLFSSLPDYTSKLKAFRHSHHLMTLGNDAQFKASVLSWHEDFTEIMDEISLRFSVTLVHAPLQYQLCVVLYVCGMGILLYYLIDNMVAHNKLTPRRIRVWVCLLVVLGNWTLLGMHLLAKAQAMENAVEATVHHLSEQLRELVYVERDLTVYHNVLMYWRTHSLPPTSPGTLHIMGVVAVRDVAAYLQYYSLPVITALLTPVVKLLLALKTVYWVKLHKMPPINDK